MHHSEKFLIDLDNMESETSEESEEDEVSSESDNGIEEATTPNKSNMIVQRSSSISRSATKQLNNIDNISPRVVSE